MCNSKLKKATIIIPTYNRANFLEVAINSALVQDYPNLEIIINDDCSIDNTKEIVKKYLKDERLQYFRNDINKGQMENYFFSIKELCTGDWVFTLADDDYFENRDHISKCMELVSNYNDFDMIVSNTKIDLGHMIVSCHQDIHEKYNLKKYNKKLFFKAWQEFPEILDSATAYRRDIFFKGFGRNLSKKETMRLVEDFDLLVLKNRVGYLYEVSYVFRNGEHSLNKFKIDIYQFILILKSFILPINYALENKIFTIEKLENIYIKKWSYYCKCTSLVSTYLNSEAFRFFLKYVIYNTQNKTIFQDIENKAIEYSKKYQKSIDEKIDNMSKLNHIYEDKEKKIENADSIIIYGTKTRAKEYKKLLYNQGKKIICFIDDFSNEKDIDGIPIYPNQKLSEIKSDLYIIATGRYDFIEKIYQVLIDKKIEITRIIS